MFTSYISTDLSGKADICRRLWQQSRVGLPWVLILFILFILPIPGQTPEWKPYDPGRACKPTHADLVKIKNLRPGEIQMFDEACSLGYSLGYYDATKILLLGMHKLKEPECP